MVRERNSECWYHEVCQMDNSCDSCIRYAEMKYLMDNSGLPKVKQRPIILQPDDCDYDTFCDLADVKTNIKELVDSGRNIYIGGDTTGNGKTSWAIKLLLKYFDEVWAGNGFRVRGMFVHVPTLLSKLKDFDNPLLKSYRDDLSKADLIVWDELAGTELSKYDYSQFLMYIESRIFNEKSNIFTGNLETIEQMKHALGDRLASRIWNTSDIYILKGKDKRK